MAAGNKKLVRDVRKRVNGLAAALKRGVGKNGILTIEHQEAISVLSEYVHGGFVSHP